MGVRRATRFVRLLALVGLGLTVGAIGALALDGGNNDGQLPSSSGAAVPSVVVPVSRGDVRSVVVLDGVVTTAPSVTVGSPEEGRVMTLVAVRGAHVSAGEILAKIRTSSGLEIQVVSPVDGVVASLTAERDQVITGGQSLVIVAPSSFEAVATVDPSLLYRLYEPPVSITTQIHRGPAPFACPFVSLGADTSDGGSALDAPVRLRCAIPGSIRVFAGVRVRLAVVTGEATDALLLPVEAVGGSADEGFVTLVGNDGQRTRRTVRLGLTDGLRVQILSGLADGDQVLDPPETEPGDLFTPGWE